MTGLDPAAHPMTVGVIGTGNMGSALVEGWARSPLAGLRLLVWDKVEALAQRLVNGDTVAFGGSLEQVASESEVVVVVVKPKDAPDVLGALGSRLGPERVVVSSMAGLTLESMRAMLGLGPALVRMMPNLGVSLGVGALALAPEPGTPEGVVGRVRRLLEPLGLVEQVPEDALDAVTAVSGSGPAFLALLIEGLEDGAVAAGLPRDIARTLVRQEALATARRLALCADSTAELRERLRGEGLPDYGELQAIEDRQVGEAFREAVQAALDRSLRLRGRRR